MLADTPFGPYLVPCLALVLVSVLWATTTRIHQLPDVPWLNHNKDEWFAKLRARLRTVANFRGSMQSAYAQFSQNNQSCVIPSMGDEILLLPANCIEWLIAQPDSLVSNLENIKEVLLPDYTLLRPDIVHNPTHHDSIRGPLTRNLAGLVPDILDEVAVAFDEIWDGDTKDWQEVCVFDSVIRVVARASNRVFVGAPLCRNQELLDIATKWAQLMPMSASVLRQVPQLIRPVLGPVVTFFNHWYARKYVKIISSEVRRRQDISRSGKDKPNDFLQWTVDLAEKSDLASERDVTMIALRLLVVNFAAIHTSTFSVTNTIFDLVCSDPSNVAQIKQETDAALATNGGKWDKSVLHHLIKLDSSMRESSRLGSFLSFGIARKVIAPDGLTAPNGTLCPYGSTIAAPTNGIHNDPTIYEDATEFKPFRFAEMRGSAAIADDADPNQDAKKDTSHLIKNANLSFVSLSSQYHPFGYGRHACPGRFFAANELKLLLAYMFQNYEFETQAERPPYKWIGSTLLPPMSNKVKVRKLEKPSGT